MRTDYPREDRMSGQSIFLKREKIMMTIMLKARGEEEDRDTDKGAKGRRDSHSHVVEG